MQNSANTEELKGQIVLVCHRLYQKNLVANHDGNITFRLPDGRYLATPTSFSKGDVKKEDILLLDAQGKVIDGPHKVFSEISWHLSIYRVRPDVACVVHAHPAAAGGFGLGGIELGVPALPEAVVSLGSPILNTKFISPLDPDLGRISGAVDLEIKRVLSSSDAFLVPGNGAWTVGQDVMQTYYRLELVEQIARQHKDAMSLGNLHRLPEALVTELLKRRPQPKPLVKTTANPKPAIPGNTAHSSDSTLLDRSQLEEIVRTELLGLLGN